jgi:tetratricopeptide (TPR) repeat protein
MLVIADIAVSRRHIQIHLQPNGYRMQDMGSPNGTMVNGKRVADVQLVDGDQIEVGNSLLRFEHPPSRPQQEMPPPPPAPPPMMAPPPAPPPMMAPPAYPPQMAYPQPGYPPQQQGYMQQPMQPQMPQLQAPPPAFPSLVQPVPQMGAPSGMPMAAQPPQPASAISGSSIAIQPMGPLGFLGNPKKRPMYFTVLGGAFLVGAIGLLAVSMRGSGTAKIIDKALDSYNTGTKDFTAAHYDTARKAFEAALALAPDSQELKHYLDACDSEDKFHKILEQAKKQLDDRKYGDALKLFDKIDKSSTQYEDAQQQARAARREAVKTIYTEASALAKNDNAAALEKVNQGLEYDPDNADLQELKNRLSNAPPPKPEEPTQVADNPPPEEPKKAEKSEPKSSHKSETKKAETKKAAEPASSGDFSKALAAYKSKDFSGAISAAKSVKSPKSSDTVKNIEDVKAAIDKASKLEGSNPKGAIDAYNTAASADKKLGGGLASFLSGKISGLQSKAGGKPSGGSSGGDPAKDAQADQLLGQARGLVSKNPSQAKALCRKVMQLYGNSAKNPKVQEAFKLLNSIKGKGDDDDEF